MPHISSRKLSDENLKKIYDQLIRVFDTAGNKRRSDLFLKEILSNTEKIMLAKRLALICMLFEGVSKSYISEILLLSPTTVNKISFEFESGKYKYTKDVLRKNSRTIWAILGDMIEDGISMKVGRKRLAWLNEINRRYNRPIFKS